MNMDNANSCSGLTKKRQFFLVIICWLLYVTLIIDRFSVEHAIAGVPSTLFFSLTV